MHSVHLCTLCMGVGTIRCLGGTGSEYKSPLIFTEIRG